MCKCIDIKSLSLVIRLLTKPKKRNIEHKRRCEINLILYAVLALTLLGQPNGPLSRVTNMTLISTFLENKLFNNLLLIITSIHNSTK